MTIRSEMERAHQAAKDTPGEWQYPYKPGAVRCIRRHGQPFVRWYQNFHCISRRAAADLLTQQLTFGE